MQIEEIISTFLETDQRILYIDNTNINYQDVFKTKYYIHHKLDDINFNKIPTDFNGLKFQYIILTEILELIDNPTALIKHCKNLTENLIILEIKYDYFPKTNDNWKIPWKNFGLANLLNQEFSYIHEIFLGYATIYFVKDPYEPEKETT